MGEVEFARFTLDDLHISRHGTSIALPLLAAASFVYPPVRGVSHCGSYTDVTKVYDMA